MAEPPHFVVARYYMTHKGYPDLEPAAVTKLEGQDCWYFYYRLPDGQLELEVLYDHDQKDWVTAVTAFSAEPNGPTPPPARR